MFKRVQTVDRYGVERTINVPVAGTAHPMRKARVSQAKKHLMHGARARHARGMRSPDFGGWPGQWPNQPDMSVPGQWPNQPDMSVPGQWPSRPNPGQWPNQPGFSGNPGMPGQWPDDLWSTPIDDGFDVQPVEPDAPGGGGGGCGMPSIFGSVADEFPPSENVNWFPEAPPQPGFGRPYAQARAAPFGRPKSMFNPKSYAALY